MRYMRMCVAAYVCLSFLCSAFSQQTASTVQRDAQAIAILQKSLGVMGGGNPSGVADLTLSGQIVQQRALENSTGTILVKMIRSDMVRVETTDSDGSTTEIVNGSRISRIRGADVLLLPMQSALNHPWQYVPVLSGSMAVDDPELAVSLVGEETIDGNSVYHIHTQKVSSQQSEGHDKMIAKLTGTELYIDKTTFMPTRRVQEVPSLLSASISVPMEFRYSDYRPVQGIMIPYAIAVYLNSQLSTEIHFTSAVLNTGVSAGEFEVTP